MKLYNSVKSFAENAPELFLAFQDYFNHKQAVERKIVGLSFSEKSLSDKETVINKLFCEELTKRTGMEIPADHDKLRRFATNSNVRYFADEIVDNLIDMILPESLMTSIGLIADIRFGGFLDSFTFDLENNGLFKVAKAGRRQRNVPAQVLEDTTATLVPVNHEVTVKTTLPEILANRKSLAKYIMKVMRSIETQMLYEAYDAFAASLENAPASLQVGSYTENALINLCQTVTAWNQGRKAVIVGTAVALKAVIPSSTNSRILLADEYVTLGHLRTFNDYDVIEMPQIADMNSDTYGLKLKDNRIYVISPASDKIMKIAVGGETLSHTSESYDHANLSMFGTVNKAWEVAALTNSIAAQVKLS